ncbi:outer membrane beta-barrel protein [Pontibacter kalidii]|uniref:outer membrane beta-barrel protein n=1 Tax=Pontibacter kalidii TaxID=2592049 RepID=UPI00225945C8|nr:outer membrane beta-barrel protein [Pontibacter kalidii]
MKNFLPFTLLLMFALCPGASFSQSQKGEVKGVLTDAETNEALPYATVAVYTAHDTAMVTFRMSDEKGVFRVPGLPVGQGLRAVITMMSFQVYRKEFMLSAEQPALDLGEVKLEPSSELLNEVLIVAETPPVLVRNDTLEFNAASFKTLPTALVEDLLKKLPGVSVDAAGNISVNGKAVHKILVDGKEFFGSDPKIASRNLPADVIEKVQVMNDPEVVRRDPHLPESEIPQVVNLTFKKGIKKGMFGKVYGGFGTDNRYEGGGLINAFRDTTQVSLLGYSNNLNRPGFGMGDMRKIGGFDRSGLNSIMMSDRGYELNGVSFGGTGEGVEQSSGGGVNFNTVTKNGIKLNLQYFYGGINGEVNQLIDTRQSLARDTLTTRRSRDQRSRSHKHQIGGKLDWKIDSLTDFSFRPSIMLGQNTIKQEENANTYRNANRLVNESDNNQRSEEGTDSFSGTYSLNRLFSKKGRVFNLFGNYEYNTVLQDRYNLALNRFFEPHPETSQLNQLRDESRDNLGIRNNISFTEPLVENLSAVIRLNSQYFRDENAIGTYAYAPESNEYDRRVDDLSTSFDRKGWRNYVTTGIQWKKGKLTVQPGVEFASLNIESDFRERKPIDQDYFYVFPSLRVRWQDLNLSYSASLREPGAMDLQPVVDNTNPLFIRYGNPALVPTVTHSVNLNLYKYDLNRALNYNLHAYTSINQNDITRERTIEPNGVQVTRPVNTDGNWYASGSARISKDFKYELGRQFSLGASAGGSFRKTLIILNEVQSYGQMRNFWPSVNAGFNLHDKIEFSQSLRLNFSQSRYEQDAFENYNTVSRTSTTYLVLRVPKRVVWEAHFEHWHTSDAVPGLRDSYGRLTAAVTFLFLKDDRAQLKLSVYDLLDQNLSASRSIRENMVEDVQTTVLNRYGMVTFIYNIRNFGGKVGSTGRNTLFRF